MVAGVIRKLPFISGGEAALLRNLKDSFISNKSGFIQMRDKVDCSQASDEQLRGSNSSDFTSLETLRSIAGLIHVSDLDLMTQILIFPCQTY